MNLNYHHLLYFKEIAIQGSLSAASKILKVGTSSLSLQLKSLEENLGTSLFDRHNKKLILTDAGRTVLDYALKIQSTGDEIINLFNNKSLKVKEEFKIGVVDSCPKSIAGYLFKSVYQNDDKIFCSLSEDSHSSLIEKLLVFNVDAVITNQPFNLDSNHIKSFLLGSSKVAIYSGEKLIKKIKKTPQDLSEQPFIIPSKDSPLRPHINNFFLKNKINYDLIGEVQDSSVKKILLSSNFCFGFLPKVAAKGLVDQGKIYCAMEETEISEGYWLLFRKKDSKKKTIKYLTQEFKLIGKGLSEINTV